MANNVVNRQVNIFIESGQAQKALDQLIKKENELKAALDKATDPKKAEQLKTELDRLQEPIERAKKKLSGELAPAFNDVKKTVNDLGNRLKRMSEQDADYTTVLHQYHEANNLLQQQQEKVGMLHHAMRSFWQEAKMMATGMLIGNVVFALLSQIQETITGIVTGGAKVSDQLADIQRVTGMTTKEVKGLNNELKKIDTRTSAEELRDMALVAGKLGVAKGDILDFVKATDKLKVALGDELGDVNTITTELGKILNVFEGKITGENITHLGNAIVDLANKGVASGPFITDFTQRVAGIAKTSNLSLGSVIGLAAGLEESGQKVESSATAIQKLLTTIATDVPKAARIAGAQTKAEIDQFADLFAKKPQEALLLYAQGLQKNKSSFAEIASSFKDAGEEGARVVSTLAVLGQKTDFFRQKVDDATEALKGSNEIEEAFRLKNESLGGQLDKVKNKLANFFTSDSFMSGAKAAVSVLGAFVNLIIGSLKFIGDHKILVGSLATIYALATTNIKAASIATIFNNAVTVVTNTVQKAAAAAVTIYRIVLVTLTRQITLASGAQMIWNTVTSLGAGPLGILLVAIGAVSIALTAMVSRFTQASAAQKLQQEIAARVAESTSDTVEKMRELTEVAKDNNVSLENRQKALKALISISPDYLKGLTLENINTDEGRKILENYNKELRTKAELEAKGSLLKDKLKRREELQLDLKSFKGSDFIQPTDATSILLESLGVGNGKKAKQTLQELTDIDDQIKILQKDIDAAGKKNVESILGGGDGTGGSGSNTAVGKLEALRKKLKDLQDQREKAPDDKSIAGLNKQIKETEDAIARLEGKTAKLSSTEKKTANDTKALAEELKQIATSLLPDDTLKEKFNKELQATDDKYAKLTAKAHGNAKLLEQVETLHQLERKKIVEKYFNEEQKLLNEGLQNEKDRNRQAEEALRAKFAPLLNKALQKIDSESNARNQTIIDKDELDVIKKKGKAKLEAQKKLIDDQSKIEIEKKQEELNKLGKDEVAKRQQIEGEIAKIRAKALQDRKDAEAEFWLKQLGYAQQALDAFNVFSEIKNNKENADLARDKKLNDAKKANLDKRLKQGLISQEQYDRQLEALQKKQEKKEQEVRTKQFKREQKAAIAQTLISAAEGAIRLWANPGFPANIPLLAILALQTGLKIGAISSQKPPEYGRGGFLYGKSHAEGGMGVFDHYGRKQAELEGGEGIGSKKTMSDRRVYNVSGTPAQIYSLLNGINGGVQWASGAQLRPGWTVQKPQPMNFVAANNSINTVRRFYAGGGQFDGNNNPVNGAANSQELMNVILHLAATQQDLTATLADIKANGIDGKVYLNDIEQQQKRKANLLKEAGNG